MALVWLVAGLILGGGVTLVFMCCLQIAGEYEKPPTRKESGSDRTDRMKNA